MLYTTRRGKYVKQVSKDPAAVSGLQIYITRQTTLLARVGDVRNSPNMKGDDGARRITSRKEILFAMTTLRNGEGFGADRIRCIRIYPVGAYNPFPKRISRAPRQFERLPPSDFT